MIKKFYLLLIFFSLFSVFAQKSTISEATNLTKQEIDKKLDNIKNNLSSNLKEKEKLLIALKSASGKINYDKGILTSGSYLMSNYDHSNRNKEITELGSELKEIIVKYKEDSSGIISSILRRNAVALGYLGLDEASRKDLNLALKYSSSIKDQDLKNYRQALIYGNMTLFFSNKPNNDKKSRDSILYFLNKSLNAAKQIKNNDGYFKNLKPESIAFTYVRLGIFYLEQPSIKGNLENAEKYLLESYKIHENRNYEISPYNRIMMLNQLSWLYMEKKEYEKSIEFANKALKQEQKYNDPSNRVESYEFLATGYMETGEKEKAKLYMSKYSFLKDSINISLRNDADTTTTKMVTEVDKEHKESSKKQLIVIGFLALISTITAFFIWRRNSKKQRRNYEHIIEKLKMETINSSEIMNTNIEIHKDEKLLLANKNVIPKDTETRILSQLEIFESSEEFLRKDLSISVLASLLNSNYSYLSEVIKNNKSSSFSNYINNLRINYIVHKLYNEPKYRSYKISYLAEVCGYASSQVFLIAFKKINGVTPSYFIQNLNEDNI